jgi:hypothetical protein
LLRREKGISQGEELVGKQHPEKEQYALDEPAAITKYSHGGIISDWEAKNINLQESAK